MLRAGFVAADLGRLQQGLGLIQKSVELDPLRVAAYDFLAYALGVMGRKAEREMAFRKLIALSPEDGPFYNPSINSWSGIRDISRC